MKNHFINKDDIIMHGKLVSIILPVHNGEKYLSDAIDSILKQTYVNFELIIVDDKSTDNSLSIAKEYQLVDSRIKIIVNEENLKLPRSLNRGFEEAQGEYLTWTSDDNIYFDNAIFDMVKYLDQNQEVHFVYADMEKIDSKGNCIGYAKSNVNDMYVYNCIGACFLYRKECREWIGEYDSDMFLVEDYDYWIRISQKYTIGHISETLYSYRLHANSLTMSRMQKIGEQLLKLKLKHFDYLWEKIDDENRECFLFELLVYDIDCLNNIKRTVDLVRKIKKLVPQKRERLCNEIYLYGAGAIGLEAIKYFDDKKIVAFIDGDKQKVGKSICGYKIISLDEIVQKDVQIIISTDVRTSYFIIQRLLEQSFTNFDILYRVI